MTKAAGRGHDELMANPDSRSGGDSDLDSADQADTATRGRELITRLIRRRVASGRSQAAVAKLMQTSQSAVARLESGQHDVQLSTLTRYAGALGLSLDFAEDMGTQARGSSPGPGAEAAEAPPEGPAQPDPDHVLTLRQWKVLQVISDFVQQRGYPPSLREIADAVGLASTSSVSFQLSTLVSKGYLRRDAGRPRTVETRLPVHLAVWPGGKIGADARRGNLSQEITNVPVLGCITASAPIFAEESAGEMIPLPRQLVGDGKLSLLKIAGDSMIGAAIADGDWVVVREQHEADDGDIVVAMADGETTVKTFKRSGNQVWLMPHNPADTPIPGDKASILGRIVTVLRSRV